MTTTAAIRYSHTVGSLSNQGRGLQNPVDVALDSQGVMYVVSRAGPEVPLRLPYKRITMCTVDEEYLGEFGTGGTGPGEFWWPSALAFDSGDRLYLADEALNRITVFSTTGEVLDLWGQAGSAPGQLNGPSGAGLRLGRASCSSPTAATTASRSFPQAVSTSIRGAVTAAATASSAPRGVLP